MKIRRAPNQQKRLLKNTITHYKYITTIYFKRAFFIINSKGFLRESMPDTPFQTTE
jgi:hypothetical protein